MGKKIYIKIVMIIIGGAIIISIYNSQKYIDVMKYNGKDIQWITEIPIAHRGLQKENCPENSMAAFKCSIDEGYPIELDVRLTKDKKVVVFHDKNLNRLTNDKRDIENITFNELKKLSLLSTNEKIPLLKKVLKEVDGKVPLLIEIKSCDDIIELTCNVNEILENYKGNYAIQSFDKKAIEWYEINNPDVVKGLLINNSKELKVINIYTDIFEENIRYIDFISISIGNIDNNDVQRLRGLGWTILTWTVKDKKSLEKANRYSDNYIFDYF